MNKKIWSYLILFSIILLLFLWFFQIVSLSSYYEMQKTHTMQKLANQVKMNYQIQENDDFLENLELISYQEGICIELTDGVNTLSYSLNKNYGECLKSSYSQKYKEDFIQNNRSIQKYTFMNNQFQNKTLIYGVKLNDSLYAFLSTSLVPIQSTVSILRSQFVYITILVLLLALIISYFISKKLSKPIVEITLSAKELSKRNYQTPFTSNTDIQELSELTDTLEQTRLELLKTDELRKDLMANVSHDLKTPLTMIKAYAEMVRDLTYRNKQKREANLNVIIEEADRLNALVNDILSLSVMESKMLILKKEKFNIIDFIQKVLQHYEIFATNLNYQFIFQPTEPVIMVEADIQKLEQVFYNLINNAINYTGADHKIMIQLTPTEQDILIEIQDTGNGIAQEELPYIWEKYYQSKKNHQRNKVGTGLGLSIVKQILELHQLEYGVKSRTGKDHGTTFYFKMKKF